MTFDLSSLNLRRRNSAYLAFTSQSLATDMPWVTPSGARAETNLAAEREILAGSGLFDPDFYRETAGIDKSIDLIEHYLLHGWRAGLEPNASFEGSFLYPYYESAGFGGPPA